jgi:hypothetical protein
VEAGSYLGAFVCNVFAQPADPPRPGPGRSGPDNVAQMWATPHVERRSASSLSWLTSSTTKRRRTPPGPNAFSTRGVILPSEIVNVSVSSWSSVLVTALGLVAGVATALSSPSTSSSYPRVRAHRFCKPGERGAIERDSEVSSYAVCNRREPSRAMPAVT